MYRALALNALQSGGIALTSNQSLTRARHPLLNPAPPTLTILAFTIVCCLTAKTSPGDRTNEVALAGPESQPSQAFAIMVAEQQRAGAGGGW